MRCDVPIPYEDGLHDRRRGAGNTLVTNEKLESACERSSGKDGATCKRSCVGVYGRCSDAVDESLDDPSVETKKVASVEKFDVSPSGEAREDVLNKTSHGYSCCHS